jgi:hypothetical protein
MMNAAEIRQMSVEAWRMNLYDPEVAGRMWDVISSQLRGLMKDEVLQFLGPNEINELMHAAWECSSESPAASFLMLEVAGAGVQWMKTHPRPPTTVGTPRLVDANPPPPPATTTTTSTILPAPMTFSVSLPAPMRRIALTTPRPTVKPRN